METAAKVAGAAAVATVAGLTYVVTSNTESVAQDFKAIRLLAGMKRIGDEWNAMSSFSLAKVFDMTLEKYPDNIAVTYIDESNITTSYTFREMDEMSNRVANWAIANGLRKGDTAALLMNNRPEFMIFWLGIAKAGGITALINTHQRNAPLKHSLTVVKPSLFIIGYEHIDAVTEVVDDIGGFTLGRWHYSKSLKSVVTVHEHPAVISPNLLDADAQLAHFSIQRPVAPSTKPDDTGLYIYTSGTTGLPKAAKMVHVRYALGTTAFSRCIELTPEDKVYCVLPLYHTAGGMLGVGGSWASGATLVLRKKFSARNFWRDCTFHGCTVVQYIGELLRYLVNQPVGDYDKAHSIRVATGNGLRPDVWGKFIERFNIPQVIEFYGATEGNCFLINTRNKFGSVGNVPVLALKYGIAPYKVFKFDVENETVVRGKDGFGIPCGPNQVGELMGKIDMAKNKMSRFDGYSNEEASQKKIIHDLVEKGDSWFRSGDLLYYDDYGNFFFSDRIGDTFRWKGENCATSEISEVLSDAKGVSEVNVLGVAVPGHDGRACLVVLVPGESFDLHEFYAYCVKNLPSYARPVFLRLTEAMEITGTFKHRKQDFKKDGFNPEKTSDSIYVRDDSAKGYRRVDSTIYNQIMNNTYPAKL